MVTDERHFPHCNTIIYADAVAACPVAFFSTPTITIHSGPLTVHHFLK